MTTDWFGTPLTPLSGGYSGETFVVGSGGGRVVVRIYRRQPDRAAIDASLLRLVKGIVPVPEVVELRPATADMPAVLITEYVDGVLLERVLRDDPPGLDREALGRNLGRLLGSLSGIPFLRFGMFADPDLAITAEGLSTDMVVWAQHFRDTGRLAAWSEPDWRSLLDLVDQAEGMLADDPTDRIVLAHSDFNPKNILVDTEHCTVTGLLDWEFAHAGSMHTDLGNFARFERDPRLLEPLVAAYAADAPGVVSDPVTLGRAVDMWALLELAGGTPTNAVRELAADLLLAQARAGDLHAWPWHTSRVDPSR